MEPFDIVRAIEELRQGNLAAENFKTLFTACTKGDNFQNFLMEKFPKEFIQQHIKTGDPVLTKTLSLCNNICVMNPTNQEKMLKIVLPLIPQVEWDESTGKYALLFLLACAQPGSDTRKEITPEVLAPLIKVYAKADHEVDEDFYLQLINIMTACPSALLEYGMAHEDLFYDITDLLHDSCENYHESIDHEELIQYILDTIRIPKINPAQAKSNMIGVFAGLVGSNDDARVKAINMGAVEVLKELKKTDIDDPALLEWSVAALRFLVQFVDPEGKPNVFQPSGEADDENFFEAKDFM